MNQREFTKLTTTQASAPPCAKCKVRASLRPSEASRRQAAKSVASLSRCKLVRVLKKPDWIRVKAGSPSTRFYEIKDILRAHKLVTVCERGKLPKHRRTLRQRNGHLA